ncbi:MAG: DeoR/GlpR family DNA-binding transcription regulator, partial [Chloroflexota bacterium]
MTNDSSLLAIERQRRIAEILQREGSVRTAELTELLNVSAVTIRADLRELEKLGDCQIIWGGAVSNRPPIEAESILEHRSQLHSESKKKIGKKAAEFVEVGQTIFVDAGTTTVEIIKHLPSDFDYLRVVTPALNVAVAATYHTYIER